VRVIGTAGHVDHGKSTLIQALTGTHPDRLIEEQKREMTIELGFAWWQLPNGEEVGVVDVPGHRDFIENMLAGIGGIDAVVFVVAADEGVMPQTREHLAILDILQIKAGVVALTKIDLIEDSDWLDLIELELRETLSGTVLENSDIVRVSAKTGMGMDVLQDSISSLLANRPKRQDIGRPRLSIDRVFTMAGFGTVVTGTLIDGSFRIGDEVEVLPTGLKGRVRGLQNHKQQGEVSNPGSRSAVNISGLNVDQIDRGHVLTHDGTLKPSRRIDVHFRLLPDASHPIKHNQEVKLFIGATEVQARLRLLGQLQLKPGEEAWLQLEPSDPVVAVRGDRYILRRPSPGETLGGGKVLDPHPGKRHKRFAQPVLDRLEALQVGKPDEVLLQALIRIGVGPYHQVIAQSNLEKTDAISAFNLLNENGQAIVLEEKGELKDKSLVTSQVFWDGFEKNVMTEVGKFHQTNPLRLGMPREEIKSKLKLDTLIFNAMFARMILRKKLAEKGPLVYVPEHKVEFTSIQKKQVDELLVIFEKAPFSPPTIKKCIEQVGEDVYLAMVDLEILLQLSGEIVLRTSDYQEAIKDVTELISKNGSMTLGQARDHWGTTRRYVQAILEFMDSQNITRRDGDARVLRKK